MQYDDKLLDMLQHQIVARGISNPRILEAMQRVPRHLFVTEELKSEAYSDKPLALPEDRATISQPYMVAYMTDVLNCQPADRILEIGTGSGYQAAILSFLCREVYTVERHYSLSVNAQRTTQTLAINNIHFHVGDGLDGWEAFAPYDKIIVTAASRNIPQKLLDQLAVNGVMLIPLGESQMQTLTLVTKEEHQVSSKSLIPCVFVPLISNYKDLTQTDDPSS
ncbi:MAG: protein-L-isoaspartate(D-aspartate) O-methyltransferase [bacterium]|jgi:protein-L-isoaspartate(D-aspartate) O-methyltransferase